jgi:protein-disulfide isomerase
MSRFRTIATPLLPALLVTASLLAGACDKKAADPAATAADATTATTGQGEVLALVAGQPITKAEIDAKTAEPLQRMEREYQRNRYQAVETALQQAVQDRLLDAEADAQGVSKDPLVSSVPPPTVLPAEVDAFYEQNRARMQGRSKEEMAPQIRQFIGQQKAQMAARQFLDGLAAKHKVEIKLEPQRVEVAATGPAKGAADAKITMVEFSDFQCPFCSRFAPTLDQVMAKYGDRVKLVFRHLPLPIHPQAPKAAEAAVCAQDQGKFWEMHDALFRNQNALGVDGLKARAAELGLDAQAFATCLDSGTKTAAVAADAADARKVGIEGTPALFVNGRLIDGAAPFEQVAALIEDELKRQAGK